jgi:hypothetical protein
MESENVAIDADSVDAIYTSVMYEVAHGGGADVQLSGRGVCGAEASALKRGGKVGIVKATIDLTQPFNPTWGHGIMRPGGACLEPSDAGPGDACDVCVSYGDSARARLPGPQDLTAADFDCVVMVDSTHALARRGCAAIDARWLCAKRVVLEIVAIEPLCCLAQPLRMLPRRTKGGPIQVCIKGDNASMIRALKKAVPSHLLVVAD